MAEGSSMNERSPEVLARYYGSRLLAHGDTAIGAGWPNEADRLKRFDVMAGLAPRGLANSSLCDIACGTGAFLTHLKAVGAAPADYLGIDICPDAIDRARAKFPQARFECRDLLAGPGPSLPAPVDYVVINGLFTVRAALDEATMWEFLDAMLTRLWPSTRRGLAFNVMSNVVDWRRDDLFHVSMDHLASRLFALAGRRVVFRNDYDLYEYTVYVYRSPVQDRCPRRG
jgi:SAM-dependent methyltransferase